MNLIKQTQVLAMREAQRGSGTTVTLTWREYAGTPDQDPTTGAYSNLPGNPKSLTLRAFWHTVGPVKSGTRIFAEIEEGDALLDLPVAILRVIAPGDTALVAGQVLTKVDLDAANNALSVSQANATAAGIVWESLIEAAFMVNGQNWVQKTRGEHLAASQDATVGDVQLYQTLLLRKAT